LFYLQEDIHYCSLVEDSLAEVYNLVEVGSPAADIAAAGKTWRKQKLIYVYELIDPDQIMDFGALKTMGGYFVGTVGPCKSLTEDLTEMQCGNIAFNQKDLNPEAEMPMIRPGFTAPRMWNVSLSNK
jgi:hypothetical protein